MNLFNKTIKNVIRNYILHETITCADRDPPWINKDIKELIREKNQACKSYHQNKNNIFSVHQFELLQSKLNFLIEKSKSNYYARISKKIIRSHDQSEILLVYIKTFLNNRKIPCIPPLLHDDKFITNFKEKAEIYLTIFLQNNVLL